MVLFSGIMNIFSPQLRESGRGIREGGGPSALMITGSFFASVQEVVISRTVKKAASLVKKIFILLYLFIQYLLKQRSRGDRGGCRKTFIPVSFASPPCPLRPSIRICHLYRLLPGLR